MMNNVDKRFWNESIETLSIDEMRSLQLKRLKKQLAYNSVTARPFCLQMIEEGIKKTCHPKTMAAMGYCRAG